MKPKWLGAALAKVGPELEEIAQSASVHRPGIRTSIEYWSSENVSLSMHVSFLASPGEDELLVISVVVSRQEDKLFMTSDITRGDGTMIAEGPERRAVSGGPSLEPALSSWLEAVISFLRGSHSMMVSVLTEGATSHD